MVGRVPRVLLLGAAALGACVLVAAYTTWPYGWDQGVYAWMAQTIRGGGVAYRDAWDMKGPTAPYLTALAQLLFGDAPAGLRWFDLALLAIGAWATYAIALRLFDNRRSAITAVVIQVGWYFALGYWNTAQPDGWMAWLTAVAALLALRSRRAPGLLAAGVLLGVALLLKPLYLLFAVPLVLLARAAPPRYGVATALALGAAGALLPLAATVALLARSGALASAQNAFINYNGGVYGALPPQAVAHAAQRAIEWLFGSRVLPIAVPLAVLGLASWPQADRSARGGMVAWLAAAFLLIGLQAKFYAYHDLVAFPPLCVLAGHGTVTVWDAWRQRTTDEGRRVAALGIPLLVLLLIQLTVYTGNDVARWVGHVVTATPEEQYLDGFGIPGNEFRIARYLRAASSPDDAVLMWGMNSGVLALSHRRAWTRFGYNLPFEYRRERPASQQLRSELVDAFSRSRPRFIVIGERHGLLETIPATPDSLECGLFRQIETDYALRQSAGELRVYERIATGPRPLIPSPCP